jgi:hypothetical protein
MDEKRRPPLRRIHADEVLMSGVSRFHWNSGVNKVRETLSNLCAQENSNH